MKLGISYNPPNKLWATLLLLTVISNNTVAQQTRQTTKALYIPLADHYAALLAYERNQDQMKQTRESITHE